MKEFEGENYILKVHDDFLKEVVVRKNKTLLAEDVWESKKISDEFKPGQRYYVLFGGEDNASVSGEARRAAASLEYAEGSAALALFSNNSYNAVMGNLFLKVNKPLVPTRFFSNRTDALVWLRAQMANK